MLLYFIFGHNAGERFFFFSLLAFENLPKCWLANRKKFHFPGSGFKNSKKSGWELYNMKSILLAVKSGYFFPMKVNN